MIPQQHIIFDRLVNSQFYINIDSAVMFSALTVIHLVVKNCRREGSAAINRGSITILLMNLGLFVYRFLWTLLDSKLPEDRDNLAKFVNAQYGMYYLYYLISVLIPIVLAAYNSLIVVVRCGELRRVVRARVGVWRRGGGRAGTKETETEGILNS